MDGHGTQEDSARSLDDGHWEMSWAGLGRPGLGSRLIYDALAAGRTGNNRIAMEVFLLLISCLISSSCLKP